MILVLSLALSALWQIGWSWANTPANTHPRTVPVTTTSLTPDAAQRWGLSETERQRFNQIMAGPQGTWRPELDPTLALGIHADTDQDRRRWAERHIELMLKRGERELAFYRVYRDLWEQRFGDQSLLDFSRLPQRSNRDPVRFSLGDRVMLFVSHDCEASCGRVLRRLHARVQSHSSPVLDLYIPVESGPALRQWAQDHDVAPRLVRQGHITLNRAAAAAARLELADQRPIVVRRRGDALTRVPALDVILGESFRQQRPIKGGRG